ncbi:hypothetical protein FACS1894151_05790 [Spirochaetia bacterium]|nr:hypothetical protein FACS1894151_05790 [Spirochaetia bacterium]
MAVTGVEGIFDTEKGNRKIHISIFLLSFMVFSCELYNLPVVPELERAIIQSKELFQVIVSRLPNKTAYATGEAFNPSGLELTGIYTDGSRYDNLAYSDYKVDSSAYNEAAAGTYPITVTYNGKTASFNVLVFEPWTNRDALVSLMITAYPKLVYKTSENLNTSGLVVTAVYGDGFTRDLSGADYDVDGSAYNKNNTGTYRINITEKASGKSTFFNVTVIHTDSVGKVDLSLSGSIGSSNLVFAITHAAVEKGGSIKITVSGADTYTWTCYLGSKTLTESGSGETRNYAVPESTAPGLYALSIVLISGSTSKVGNLSVVVF